MGIAEAEFSMADYDTYPSISAATMPARNVLRQETRTDHDRVDKAFSRFDLGTNDGYARFLGAQWLACREAEAWLASNAEAIPPALQIPERSHLLVKDLADLGTSPPEHGLPYPMPMSLSSASLTGVAYCLAGSSFGARVLIKRIPEDFPRAFLASKLPDKAWQDLIRQIELVQLAGNLPAAISGARHTFRMFQAAADRMATA